MGGWSVLFQVGLCSSPDYDPWKLITDYAQRYALGYHSASQVLWGVGIGIIFGATFYTLAEWIPERWPESILGKIRIWILTNEVSTWFRLRDGWLIWDDAGREVEWQMWRRALAVAAAGRTKSE